MERAGNSPFLVLSRKRAKSLTFGTYSKYGLHAANLLEDTCILVKVPQAIRDKCLYVEKSFYPFEKMNPSHQKKIFQKTTF
jgi:hypothetical protein